MKLTPSSALVEGDSEIRVGSGALGGEKREREKEKSERGLTKEKKDKKYCRGRNSPHSDFSGPSVHRVTKKSKN